jgi:hypothetical protein
VSAFSQVWYSTDLSDNDANISAIILRLRGEAVESSIDSTIEHAFPIVNGFTVGMAQAKRATLDLSSASLGSLRQSKAGESNVVDVF